MKESPSSANDDSTTTTSTTTTTDPLNHCNRLISQLLDDHLHIHLQSFKGKWSLLRTKLTSLTSLLSDFHEESLPLPHSSNSMFLDLLTSISNTLSTTLSLADKCHNPPDQLPDGKLRTQSDLDSILARLDRHLNDSNILLRSGVLNSSLSSVNSVSTPGISTPNLKREAVRTDTRNLLTRLQIGATKSKEEAIDSLLELLQEDDKNVMIAVAQGIVPVLVRILDSPSSSDMKERTVAAIARVSQVESSKHVLLAEGLLLLNHLLRVIESGTGFAKEKACVALQGLTFSKENARSIGSRGGISSLLEICQGGTPSSQAVAAGVLRNLSQFEETKENFVEENAVFVLISVVASGTPLAQENAIGCLSNLVSYDQGLKVVVVREGVIGSLKNYWDSNPVEQSFESSVVFVRNLGSYEPIGEVLVSEGFIGRICPLVRSGVLGVRIAAAGALYELGFSSKSRKEIGELGCIPHLARMLEGKAFEERQSAAIAISRLMICSMNRKIFKEEERGVVSLVLMLDPTTGGQIVDKVWVISALTLLAESNKCRKEMLAAGTGVFLHKLMEMDVDGAKKLLEFLGRGRLWGVFSRP